MGYIFNYKDAKAYEKVYDDPVKKEVSELQVKLMIDMLRPNKGDTILDVGCGTGFGLMNLIERGVQITGIDPSPYMLDIAKQNLGNRVNLYRGFAEDLPFEDNHFNYGCLLTTLEFVEDPQRALREICRVAKDRIFIGVLNKYAIKGIQRRVEGIFARTIYNRARFYSVWELKGMIRSILGDVPLSWRTVYQFPMRSGNFFYRIEKHPFIQKCPFGAFAGMVVTLVPRFKTKPLTLKYRIKKTTEVIPG